MHLRTLRRRARIVSPETELGSGPKATTAILVLVPELPAHARIVQIQRTSWELGSDRLRTLAARHVMSRSAAFVLRAKDTTAPRAQYSFHRYAGRRSPSPLRTARSLDICRGRHGDRPSKGRTRLSVKQGRARLTVGESLERSHKASTARGHRSPNKEPLQRRDACQALGTPESGRLARNKSHNMGSRPPKDWTRLALYRRITVR